jgi:hypothetical protein
MGPGEGFVARCIKLVPKVGCLLCLSCGEALCCLAWLLAHGCLLAKGLCGILAALLCIHDCARRLLFYIE